MICVKYKEIQTKTLGLQHVYYADKSPAHTVHRFVIKYKDRCQTNKINDEDYGLQKLNLILGGW